MLSRAVAIGLLTACSPMALAQSDPITATGTSFALNGKSLSYVFHANESTGDLITDHFGGLIGDEIPLPQEPAVNGWVGMPGRVRREFPDTGRGDFRVPAVRIRQSAGYTVSELRYDSHEIKKGKESLPGLPSLFGDEDDVSTLVVHLYDNYSSVAADLSYSVFPAFDAVVRSVNVTNKGEGNVTIENLASFSADFEYEELEMISLRGDWAREANRQRRKIEYGTQGFGSSTGYSSHLHNPFLAIVHPWTTESQGEAWGFNLVYTGSFSAEVEKSSQGFTRALLGFNPSQLSWNLGPNETLTSPEAVSVYSDNGIGGMSRKFHRLYRKHLIKSKFATSDRPILLNSWEGLYFDYNQSSMYDLAEESAALGIRLFVMDDGWFGDEYPRLADNAGLGDWEPNPERFPNGLEPLVDNVTNLTANTTTSDSKLRFGIWVEPEMVNPNSTLYREHPDWVLHAGPYPRTERRNQLVLNVALPEVQDFIIDFMTNLLNSSDITYIKWDNNRGIHEEPSPSNDHEYMLGIYRVFDTLTTRFPDVLWEGCASGGGRFDPGVLQYFPQIWTSDNTDGVDRVTIQFGTSLAYPPSAMGAHLSAVPNHQTGRTVPVTFRAHVAMMGGSFGLELNPEELDISDQNQLHELLELAERVNPIILNGDMYRLRLPEESQWPAALFVSEDQGSAVLFYFQLSPNVNHAAPWVRLEGLEKDAKYRVDVGGEDEKVYSGQTLMNKGLQYTFGTEYGSRVVLIEREE